MKQFFFITLFVLVVMSIIAVSMEPKSNPSALTWVSDDNPVREAQVALFEKLHPDIKVQLDPANSGTQKVIVQAIAGTGPDLFDSYGAEELDSYTSSGVAWDITDKLRVAGIKLNRDVWPVLLNGCVKDGKTYAVPTNSTASAIWVNKDTFAKAGIAIPTHPLTWDEFIPLAQKLTVRDSTGHVVQWGMLQDWDCSTFIWQWGGNYFNPAMTRCTLDSPQAIAGVQFLHDLVYKYHVLPSPLEQSSMATSGGWGSGTITLFEGGHSAMAAGGRWWLVTARKDPNLHLAAIDCPWPANGMRAISGGGRVTMINAKSPKREQALEFLKFLSSREYNEGINDSADGVCAFKKYAYTEQFEHNPKYPQETDNKVWRDAMLYGRATLVSPFINSSEQSEIITKQMDLIESDEKSVPEAMKDAAAEVNAVIQRNVSRDPKLMAEYKRRGGGMGQ